MGSGPSKSSDVPPQTQSSEATVKQDFEAQRREFERKCQRERDSIIAAQDEHEKVVKIAATLRSNYIVEMAEQQKLQEEAILLATQRKEQEKAFLAVQRKLQEEVTYLEAQRKLQQEIFINEYRKLQEEADKAAAQRKLEEAAFKRKLEEEAARSKLEEEAAKTKLEEEASKKILEELATRVRNKPSTACVSRSRYCNTCYKLSTMMFKCDEGHASCSSCRRSWRSCGICSSAISARRSFDPEHDLSPQTQLPCPNTGNGCKMFTKIADMEAHMKECPYKLRDCPLGSVFGNCNWQGELNCLSRHFVKMHPHCFDTEVSSELHIKNIHKNRRYVCLIENGYHFVFHLKISEIHSKVYMVVQLMGTRHSALQCLYEIQVYNKSESGRKYMYSNNCCSTIDNIDDVFMNEECAVLPMWYAKTFVTNGALTVKYFIKRINETTDFGRYQRNTSIFYLEDD